MFARRWVDNLTDSAVKGKYLIFFCNYLDLEDHDQRLHLLVKTNTFLTVGFDFFSLLSHAKNEKSGRKPGEQIWREK